MKSDTVRRTPLEICSLAVMVMALTVMVLLCVHILGLGILSWIIPGIPPPQPHFYSSFISLFALFCFPYLILRSLKNVLARKCEDGYRPELVLIFNSLLSAAFVLLISEDYIQSSGAINNYFITIAIVLALLAWVFIIIALVCKFFIDKERIKDETYQHSNTDSRQ